jgi:hypothetical protein
MDSAYLEITEKNKKDFDKAQEEWREKIRIESELAEKAAKDNIPNWIERGHKAFTEDKWEEWDKIVPIRAEDLYHGMELDCVLKLISLANQKESTFEDFEKEFYDQGHSGLSYSLTKALFKEFSDKGKEFYEWSIKKSSN